MRQTFCVTMQNLNISLDLSFLSLYGCAVSFYLEISEE